LKLFDVSFTTFLAHKSVTAAKQSSAQRSTAMTSSTIPVVVTLPADFSANKSILRRAGTIVQGTVDIDTEKLKANLTGLVEKIKTVIAVAQAAPGSLALDEVEVGIEVTAEGGVALIGTVGATASMTLTFKRKA
jgi:hypothetical protein